MNSLHILQRQFLGTQILTHTVNFARDLEFVISVGALCYRFRPLKDAASMQYLSVHSIPRLQLD